MLQRISKRLERFIGDHKGLQEIPSGYRELQGYTRVTSDYKSLHEITRGYRRLKGVTSDYKGLQGITRVYRDYMRLKGNTGVYRGLQGYTRVRFRRRYPLPIRWVPLLLRRTTLLSNSTALYVG